MTTGKVTVTPEDCDRPCDVLLELSDDPGTDEFLSRDVQTAPGRKGPLLKFPPRVSATNRGSLLPYVDGELFVRASVKDPARIPQFGFLSSMRAAFVVGPEIKALIDTMRCPRSEFIPVSIELSKRKWTDGQSTDAIGGGEILRGVYHIWNVFNRLDLIDPTRSTESRSLGQFIRYDLDGHPETTMTFYSSLGPLVLAELPFDHMDVFQIVGFDAVLVSPRFAEKIRAAGFLGFAASDPVARVMFEPFHLELGRSQSCVVSLKRRPPLRICGTDTIVADKFGEPFQRRIG